MCKCLEHENDFGVPLGDGNVDLLGFHTANLRSRPVVTQSSAKIILELQTFTHRSTDRGAPVSSDGACMLTEK